MTGTQQLNTTKRLQKNMEQGTSVWSGVHFPSRINCSCTVERTKKRSSCFKKQKHIGVKKKCDPTDMCSIKIFQGSPNSN